jgi:hypothetical protein
MCRHTSRAAAIGGKIDLAYRIAMNGFRNWSLGVYLQGDRFIELLAV